MIPMANYNYNNLGDFWKPPENENPVKKRVNRKLLNLTTKTKKRMPPKTVFKPCQTNPSGLTHFYSGEEVPWDVESNTDTTADEYAELEIVNEARNWI